jgi:hypothetical protein
MWVHFLWDIVCEIGSANDSKMLALDRDSAVAHQKGLVKMLLATPQSFRADIGPLIAIVKMYVAITFH